MYQMTKLSNTKKSEIMNLRTGLILPLVCFCCFQWYLLSKDILESGSKSLGWADVKVIQLAKFKSLMEYRVTIP